VTVGGLALPNVFEDTVVPVEPAGVSSAGSTSELIPVSSENSTSTSSKLMTKRAALIGAAEPVVAMCDQGS